MIARTLAQIAASNAVVPWMTCLGLIIFATIFIAMLFWTARRENQALYQAMSTMPLNDGETPKRAGL